MRRDIPWTTLLIEGIAIVVSILLAFAIDAWWDGRKDRAEEIEILKGLEIEFVDLRERLDLWARTYRDGIDTIDTFLTTDVREMDLPDFEAALAYGYLVNVLDQGGPLDALLASGRLEMIQDEGIRTRLAKWPDWLEDIHTNDLSVRDWAWREYLPLLHRHGSPDFICPEPEWWCLEPGPVPGRYFDLADSQELRAMLTSRRIFLWASARDHEAARGQADEILELIRARLMHLESI